MAALPSATREDQLHCRCRQLRNRHLPLSFGTVLTVQRHEIVSVQDLGLKIKTTSRGALADPKRLAVLRATGLLDAQPLAGFDHISRLGKAALNVPVTFISLVGEYRDFYLSQCGFGEPLAA